MELFLQLRFELFKPLKIATNPIKSTLYKKNNLWQLLLKYQDRDFRANSEPKNGLILVHFFCAVFFVPRKKILDLYKIFFLAA